jgi:hypothetical protein
VENAVTLADFTAAIERIVAGRMSRLATSRCGFRSEEVLPLRLRGEPPVLVDAAVMTRSVADMAILLDFIVSPDPEDRRPRPRSPSSRRRPPWSATPFEAKIISYAFG